MRHSRSKSALNSEPPGGEGHAALKLVEDAFRVATSLGAVGDEVPGDELGAVRLPRTESFPTARVPSAALAASLAKAGAGLDVGDERTALRCAARDGNSAAHRNAGVGRTLRRTNSGPGSACAGVGSARLSEPRSRRLSAHRTQDGPQAPENDAGMRLGGGSWIRRLRLNKNILIMKEFS